MCACEQRLLHAATRSACVLMSGLLGGCALGADRCPRMRAQFAELAALPEGVPEVVPITCAGRSAVLAIRSQMVAFAGQRMSASRFETVRASACMDAWEARKRSCSGACMACMILPCRLCLRAGMQRRACAASVAGRVSQTAAHAAPPLAQVCGKGDAKKWKSSIWLQGADGGQEQVLLAAAALLLCL